MWQRSTFISRLWRGAAKLQSHATNCLVDFQLKRSPSVESVKARQKVAATAVNFSCCMLTTRPCLHLLNKNQLSSSCAVLFTSQLCAHPRVYSNLKTCWTKGQSWHRWNSNRNWCCCTYSANRGRNSFCIKCFLCLCLHNSSRCMRVRYI